jgi:cleavage and polyadenylation specificity factor subunit 1
VKAIKDYNPPKTIKQLRRFLGILNFYHRFLPKAAEHQAPLDDNLGMMKCQLELTKLKGSTNKS